MFADCTSYNEFFKFYFSRIFFTGFVKAELIKLAKMAGVMHEAEHAYSIRSTWWWLHRLATDVPMMPVLLIRKVFLYTTWICRIFC